MRRRPRARRGAARARRGARARIRRACATRSSRGDRRAAADSCRCAITCARAVRAGLGYYAAGARKLGAAGDFTTAPELTPLFAHALAVAGRRDPRCDAARRDRRARRRERPARGRPRAGARARGRAPSALRDRRAEPRPARAPARRASRASCPRGAIACAGSTRRPQRIDGAVVMNEVLDAIPPHVVVARRRRVARARRHAGARRRVRRSPTRAGRRARRARRARALSAGRRLRERDQPRRRGARRGSRPPPRRRRARRDRLRLSAARVLPSGPRDRHADGALPPSRDARPVRVAGARRPHLARRLHGDRAKPARARASASPATRRRRRS